MVKFLYLKDINIPGATKLTFPQKTQTEHQFLTNDTRFSILYICEKVKMSKIVLKVITYHLNKLVGWK